MYPKPRISYPNSNSNQFHRRGGGGNKHGNRGSSSGQNHKRRKMSYGATSKNHWDALGDANDGNTGLDYGGDSASTASLNPPPIIQPRVLVPEGEDLVHEQIWDDSALVEAWDAAMEEYRMLNGPDKDWKTESSYKDSLWYWDGKTGPKKGEHAADADETPKAEDEENEDVEGSDSEEVEHELNERTDLQDAAYAEAFEALPDTSQFTTEELFQKAMEASYWAGFWASAYKSSSSA